MDWMQGLILPLVVGTLLAVIGIILKRFNDRLNEEKKEQEILNRKIDEQNRKREEALQELVMSLKDGVLAILHDRLYQACSHHINCNCISPSEMRNLEKMYRAYSKLGGNGTIKEMYERCMNLPICFKEGEPHEN